MKSQLVNFKIVIPYLSIKIRECLIKAFNPPAPKHLISNDGACQKTIK